MAENEQSIKSRPREGDPALQEQSKEVEKVANKEQKAWMTVSIIK